MRKLLLVENYDFQSYYIENNSFSIQDSKVVNGIIHLWKLDSKTNVKLNLSDCSHLQEGRYQSVFNHKQIQRLIEIDTLILQGKLSEAEVVDLFIEAKELLVILDSFENKELEQKINKEKIEYEVEEEVYILDEEDYDELAQHLSQETIDPDMIVGAYEDITELIDERLLKNYPEDSSIYEAMEKFFDYKSYGREIIELEEGFFETSVGKIIEYIVD